jgi:hypothetical protein
VSVTLTDPGSGHVKSVTVDTFPWVKSFDVDDPNAINARFLVDDGNNINGVTCTIWVNRTVLVEKAINGGDSGTCAALHF